MNNSTGITEPLCEPDRLLAPDPDIAELFAEVEEVLRAVEPRRIPRVSTLLRSRQRYVVRRRRMPGYRGRGPDPMQPRERGPPGGSRARYRTEQKKAR